MRTKTQDNSSLRGKTLALVAILALLLVVLMSGVDPVVAGGGGSNDTLDLCSTCGTVSSDSVTRTEVDADTQTTDDGSFLLWLIEYMMF